MERNISIQREKNWRVKIKINNKYHIKYFSFKKYGGKDAALKLAIEYRNALLEEHGLLHRLENSTQVYSHRTKKPIIIGVRFLYNKYNKKDGTSYWLCEYTINGKKYKRHFSIEKYGYEEAFLMACRTRYENSGVLSIYNTELLPCEPDVPYIIRD